MDTGLIAAMLKIVKCSLRLADVSALCHTRIFNPPNHTHPTKMKTTLCLLTCVVLHASLHAATWRVDNNTSHPADFRTIEEAVDAAAVGDTILVAGSNFEYGGFILTKRLSIKGERPSSVGSGTRIVGSVILTEINDDVSPDYLRNAGGSVLEGLVLQTLEIHGPCSGVTVKRCDTGVYGIYLRGCSGTLIINCATGGISTVRGGFGGGGRGIGTGNAVVGTWAGLLHLGDPTNTSVENCVIGYYVGGESQDDGPIHSYSDTAPFVIRDSIIIGKTSAHTQGRTAEEIAKANFDHCLLISGSTLPAGNGNINRAYIEFPNVFVDATPGSTNPDAFVLKAGSPALGAGIGGVDLGMYGGASPFVKDLIPALPRVNYLAVPPVVPHATGLSFEVRAEARD